MASIHDSLLVGYTVDGSKRTVVFSTAPDRGAGGAFEIRFSDVIAYHVEGDCLQNIVFDVVEVTFDEVVGDGSTFIARNHQHGWPPGWDPERESVQTFFQRQGGRMFHVGCSYGLSAWVVAGHLEIVPRAAADSAGQQGAAADGASPRC